MTVLVNPLQGAAAVLVTAVGGAEGARPAAAALACAGADSDRASLLVDLGGRPPRPTLLSSAPARALEERLAAHLPRARVAARGQVCHLAPGADPDGLEESAAALSVAREAIASVYVPPAQVQRLLESPAGARLSGALLRAELAEGRALVALAVRDLGARGLSVVVLKRRLTWVAERRALFGTLAPGAPGGPPAAAVDRLLGRPEASVSRGRGFRAAAVRDST